MEHLQNAGDDAEKLWQEVAVLKAQINALQGMSLKDKVEITKSKKQVEAL